MKAVVYTKYGPPEVLHFKEIDKPVPKDNEVLIRVRATTVTVADYRIRSFDIPKSFYIPARLALGITGPRKRVLGAELAGVIESIGKSVTKYSPGDEVFASTLASMGGYAEYKCIREDGLLEIKPKNISFEDAAAIPIGACTALLYLQMAGIKKGQKVLVYGASGSVGTYAVQLANYFGADVTGVCSSVNIELVRSLGVTKVLDYTMPDFFQQLEKYDIIFVAVDKFPFSVGRNHLTEGGVFVNITLPFKTFEMMMSKVKVISGSPKGDHLLALRELKEFVEAGTLKVVVDRKYTLDQIVEAHRYVSTGRKRGNVVVTVNA